MKINSTKFTRTSQLGVLAFAIFGALSSFAESSAPVGSKPILKITTPSGQVIYTDRGLNGVNAQKTETLRGAITDKVLATSGDAKKAESTTGDQAGQTTDSAKEQDAANKKLSQDPKDAKAAIAKINCDNAKSNLQSIQGLNGARLSHVNDKGQVVFYTEAEIAEQKSQAQKIIAQNCS
jgi:hypothetical protein